MVAPPPADTWRQVRAAPPGRGEARGHRPPPPHFSRVSVFLEGSWKVSGESRGVDVLISLDPGEPGVSSAARGARHKLWVALAARFCFFLLLVVVVIF